MTTHKWRDIEHKRDQRIANLIAQARDEVMHLAANGIGDNGALYLALADALEAAEAQRDALAKAILAALNELAVKEARAAVPLINEKVRERDAALAERDALQGDVDKLVGKIGALTEQATHAEAERDAALGDESAMRPWREENARLEAINRRLREALEQIESDIHPARPTDEERPRWLDENSVWWNHLSPQEIARAALAGSGDG